LYREAEVKVELLRHHRYAPGDTGWVELRKRLSFQEDLSLRRA